MDLIESSTQMTKYHEPKWLIYHHRLSMSPWVTLRRPCFHIYLDSASSIPWSLEFVEWGVKLHRGNIVFESSGVAVGWTVISYLLLYLQNLQITSFDSPHFLTITGNPLYIYKYICIYIYVQLYNYNFHKSIFCHWTIYQLQSSTASSSNLSPD